MPRQVAIYICPRTDRPVHHQHRPRVRQPRPHHRHAQLRQGRRADEGGHRLPQARRGAHRAGQERLKSRPVETARFPTASTAPVDGIFPAAQRFWGVFHFSPALLRLRSYIDTTNNTTREARANAIYVSGRTAHRGTSDRNAGFGGKGRPIQFWKACSSRPTTRAWCSPARTSASPSSPAWRRASKKPVAASFPESCLMKSSRRLSGEVTVTMNPRYLFNIRSAASRMNIAGQDPRSLSCPAHGRRRRGNRPAAGHAPRP